jgi:hypothetical protein
MFLLLLNGKDKVFKYLRFQKVFETAQRTAVFASSGMPWPQPSKISSETFKTLLLVKTHLIAC